MLHEEQNRRRNKHEPEPQGCTTVLTLKVKTTCKQKHMKTRKISVKPTSEQQKLLPSHRLKEIFRKFRNMKISVNFPSLLK